MIHERFDLPAYFPSNAFNWEMIWAKLALIEEILSGRAPWLPPRVVFVPGVVPPAEEDPLVRQ